MEKLAGVLESAAVTGCHWMRQGRSGQDWYGLDSNTFHSTAMLALQCTGEDRIELEWA